MATLNDLVGFETGSFDEVVNLSGSPAINAGAARSGGFGLRHIATAGTQWFPFTEGKPADAGANHIVGMAFSTGDVTDGAAVMNIKRTDLSPILTVLYSNATTMQLQFQGVAGGITGTMPPLVDNEFVYVEVWFGNAAASPTKLWVNGNLVIDRSSDDSSGTVEHILFSYSLGGSPDEQRWDDMYYMTGAAGPEERLGDINVIAYQNSVEDATDQGSTLDINLWSDCGQTPFSEETEANSAGYTANAAADGHVICDEGARDGPLTGGRAPAEATDFRGAKYMFRLARSGGGGTVHHVNVGNSVDGVTQRIVSVGNNYAWFNEVETSDAIVPSLAQDAALGFGKATGGRDITCAEMWCFVAHQLPNRHITKRSISTMGFR